jgi:hypothetical protein
MNPRENPVSRGKDRGGGSQIEHCLQYKVVRTPSASPSEI